MTSATAGNPTPKERRHLARRQQILDAALKIAQQEGWPAVTTRRLAEAIDYSQPVLYQHFANRDDLMFAVALEGFATLSGLVGAAATTAAAPLEATCRTYLAFADAQPHLYEVMFSLPTGIRFDSPDTPAAISKTFDLLTALISHEHGESDAEAAAEFFWAACHGLATLMSAGRIPADRLDMHIARAVRSIAK